MRAVEVLGQTRKSRIELDVPVRELSLSRRNTCLLVSLDLRGQFISWLNGKGVPSYNAA
jgi:hypothetical protein